MKLPENVEVTIGGKTYRDEIPDDVIDDDVKKAIGAAPKPPADPGDASEPEASKGKGKK